MEMIISLKYTSKELNLHFMLQYLNYFLDIGALLIETKTNQEFYLMMLKI